MNVRRASNETQIVRGRTATAAVARFTGRALLWLYVEVLGLPLALFGATVAMAGAIEIRSTTNCPATADIEARLRPLLPRAASTRGPSHLATLELAEVRMDGTHGLRLHVAGRDGAVIGERRLFLRGSCQEMAEAVAIVIAAWTTEPVPSGEASRARDPQPEAEAVPAAPPPAPLQAQPGLALGAVFGSGVAASGHVEVQVGRRASRWQVRLGGMTESVRSFTLSPGHVEWQRTGLSASLVFRTLHPHWLGALDAGAIAGWATLQGRDYDADYRRHTFDAGLAAGARVGWPMGRIVLWTEARATVWSRGQHVLVEGAAVTADLPRVELGINLGVSLGRF